MEMTPERMPEDRSPESCIFSWLFFKPHGPTVVEYIIVHIQCFFMPSAPPLNQGWLCNLLGLLVTYRQKVYELMALFMSLTSLIMEVYIKTQLLSA